MRTTYLDGAKHMPALKHKVGSSFNIMTSEVCDYLCSLPEVRQRIFDLAKEKKFIIYDPETKTWRGNMHETD